MSSGIKTTDFLKMLRGPETKEEAIEFIKENKVIMSTLRTTAHLGASVGILVEKGIVTEEDYLKIFDNVLESQIKSAANGLLNESKHFEEEEDVE